MALLHEEEGNHNPQDKRRNKAQKVDKLRNLKRHILLVSLYLWQSLVMLCLAFGNYVCSCFKHYIWQEYSVNVLFFV